MQFHKKHGVFEACKKVCEDFFDTLKCESFYSRIYFYSIMKSNSCSLLSFSKYRCSIGIQRLKKLS